MRKCANCGIQLQEELIICPNCSKKNSFYPLSTQEDSTELDLNDISSTAKKAVPPSYYPSSSGITAPGPFGQSNSGHISSPGHFPPLSSTGISAPGIFSQSSSMGASSPGHIPYASSIGISSPGTYYWSKPAPSQINPNPPDWQNSGFLPQVPPSGTFDKKSSSKHTDRNTSRISNMIIALIVALVFLLIGSGIGLIYYTSTAHTRTVTITVTPMPNHHTAAKKVVVTPAVAVQTKIAPHIQTTVASTQNIYNQATKGTPDISSTLAYQTNNRWQIYPTADGGGCAFTGGSLHASIFAKHYYVPCIAQSTNLHNFTMQINMTIVKGDAGGIIFRANDNDKNFYSFRIQIDGSYELMLTTNKRHSAIVNDTTSAIHKGPGHRNLITVVAQNTNFYFYINRQYVGSASDSTYSSGSIGVLAIDLRNDTNVSFNQLSIWNN